MKKYFLAILITILLLLPNTNILAWNESTGGGGENEAGDGTGSAWIYTWTYFGVRMGLYTYDGTTLTEIKTIDFMNSPIDGQLWLSPNRKNRLYYTHLGNSVGTFTKQDGNFKKLSDYGIDFEIDIGKGPALATALIDYFGDDSNSIIKKVDEMFGVTIPKAEFSKYYLVVEATTAFNNRTQGIYIYGTGYEIINQIDYFNGSAFTGGYQWNLAQSQAVTFTNYLYESIYVKKDSSKLNKYGCQVGNSYDCHNFVNGESSEKGLITAGSFKDFSNVNDIISSGYANPDFPYGLTILWLGEKGGCTTVCDGKTGDNLLKCAEEFCSSDTEIDSKAEKADCIKNQCKYEFNVLNCGADVDNNGIDTICDATTSSRKKTCEIVNTDYYSYKVECDTKTTVNYPNTLPQELKITEGFKYQVEMHGNKKCVISFDKELWKFDYASSYSETDKTNYLNAIDNYNNMNLDYYNYDSSDSNIVIGIEERIKGTNVKTSKTLQKENEYYSGSDDVYYTYTNSTVKSYSGGVATRNQTVRTFTTDSSNGVYYNLPKVCFSSQDRYTVEEKDTCDNDFGPYQEYFTDIDSDIAKNNTKTSVKQTSSAMDVENTCHYNVVDDNNDLACSINLVNGKVLEDGETVIYENTPLQFELNIYNRKNVAVNYDLKMSNGTICTGTNCIVRKNDFNTGDYLTVTGTVSYGTEIVKCSKRVKIIDDTDNICRFVVTKNDTTRKTTIAIRPVNGATYYIKQATSNTWMNTRTVTFDFDDNVEMIGMIVLADGTKKTGEDCFYSQDDYNENTCPEIFKPVQYQEIRQYCNLNWKEDKSGYYSADDCYHQCTIPTDYSTCKTKFKCTNLASIKSYCTSNFGLDGYLSKDDCINDCSCSGIKYVYRPIDKNNPFPNREANWNWLGYEHYIISDESDETSLETGKDEYEIVLSQSRMEQIRTQTKRYNDERSNNDAYGDYVREDEEELGEYKSKFIHSNDIVNGGFNSYFTIVDGSKIR